MNLTLAGWNATGVLALIAITAGIVLLVVYASRRGFVNRDLDGTIDSGDAAVAMPAPEAEAPARPRALGIAGAALLAVGLALGIASAVLGWGVGGGGGAAGDRSAQPADCATSWNGCPQATAPAPAPSTSAP
jgi:hypothetical protein